MYVTISGNRFYLNRFFSLVIPQKTGQEKIKLAMYSTARTKLLMLKRNLGPATESLDTVTINQNVLNPVSITPENLTLLPLTGASVEMVKADMGIMLMEKWALTLF